MGKIGKRQKKFSYTEGLNGGYKNLMNETKAVSHKRAQTVYRLMYARDRRWGSRRRVQRKTLPLFPFHALS